jgi:hypothetical protein
VLIVQAPWSSLPWTQEWEPIAWLPSLSRRQRSLVGPDASENVITIVNVVAQARFCGCNIARGQEITHFLVMALGPGNGTYRPDQPATERPDPPGDALIAVQQLVIVGRPDDEPVKGGIMGLIGRGRASTHGFRSFEVQVEFLDQRFSIAFRGEAKSARLEDRAKLAHGAHFVRIAVEDEGAALRADLDQTLMLEPH